MLSDGSETNSYIIKKCYTVLPCFLHCSKSPYLHRGPFHSEKNTFKKKKILGIQAPRNTIRIP